MISTAIVKMQLRSVISAALLVGAIVFPGHLIAGEVSDERQTELSRLVRQDCGSCHGMTLKGGLGTSLLQQDLEELTSEEISEIILEGISGTPMPGWKGLLTTSEAFWIADQLKNGSIKKGNAQ